MPWVASPMFSERVLNYTTTMPATASVRPTFQSSDLSRHSAKVFTAAEEEPVTVTRRDGEDLVLMSKKEATSRERLLELAATLIAVSIDDRGSLADRMANALPWMLALGPEDRAHCASDVVSAARASFATGQASLAAAAITSWRETATALAAGLGDSRVEWLDEDDPVERP